MSANSPIHMMETQITSLELIADGLIELNNPAHRRKNVTSAIELVTEAEATITSYAEMGVFMPEEFSTRLAAVKKTFERLQLEWRNPN